MQNLKDVYTKSERKQNKKTGAVPDFPPYSTQIYKIIWCRDVVDLPEITKVGGNSISDNEINTSSDLDSDVNKSNVLKQVPKKIFVKVDNGKLKFIF